MTIIDSSHSKAQEALSSSRTPDDDELPSYSGPSSSSAAHQFNTSYALPNRDSFNPSTFETEEMGTLNPESAKKLSREARERGVEVGDYGFEPEERLPEFGESEAEERTLYDIDGDGNIVSHDHLLNTSPTALLRFFHLQSSSPPSLTIHLRGSHTETRVETVHETINGHHRTREVSRSEEVEDFNFAIPGPEDGLGRARGGGMRGVLYEAGGWEAARRGGWRSVQREGVWLEEEGRRGWRKVGVCEGRRLEGERRERDRRGLPGFVHPDSLIDMEEPESFSPAHPPVLFRSHLFDSVEAHASVPFALTGVVGADETLVREREAREEDVRRVVEEYCRSDKMLKELKVKKQLYGWNWVALEAALRETIDRTYPPPGVVQIQFKVSPETIIVRPENWLSRIFSYPLWAKILLWLCLAYPTLLLLELLSGSRFSNLRLAYPLIRWRPLPLPPSSPLTPQSAVTLARTLAPRPPKVAQTPEGDWAYLVGTQEGEWMREWEGMVVDEVRKGRRGGVLRIEGSEESRRRGVGLRGYSTG